MKEKRKKYRLLVGKPEEKIPLGRPRRTWMNNTKIVFGDIEFGGSN
jgi:hypothetical protein